MRRAYQPPARPAHPIICSGFALPALAEIHAPIRAIKGEKYPTNLEGNRRHYRDFDAAILKDTGHFLMIEDPKRFNALLADALRQMR